MILTADVGGTHTRLALAVHRDGRWQLTPAQVDPTGRDLEGRIAAFLRAQGQPPLAAFACSGAGPLRADGSIQLTNADVELRPERLAAAAGVGGVTLVNDFAAVARALPELGPADLKWLGGGSGGDRATRLVLGPGTGLGVAALAPCAGGWTVITGEGGHADLAPRGAEQLEILRRVSGGRRIPVEGLLSGPGLERLYSANTGGELRAAQEIADAAWHGEPESRRVIEIFADWLGGYAGSLALIFGAQGGIYLAGGILPAWGEHFPLKTFLAALVDKAPYTDYLRDIPVYLIVHPQPGLIGLAAMAQERLQAQDGLARTPVSR